MGNSVEFGEGVSPAKLVRIRAPKNDATQRCWIVVSRRDRGSSVMGYYWRTTGELDSAFGAASISPMDLWDQLADAHQFDGKAWVVCFGLAQLLESAKWLDALADGTIKLPSRKGKDGVRRRTGKLSLSASCSEVDLVIRGKRYKLIDFANFGIEAVDDQRTNKQDGDSAEVIALKSLLTAADCIDLPINKPTAAQIGYAKLRSKSAHCPILTCPDQSVRDLERRAYFGGRNEPYRLGDIAGPVWSYDLRSCYAAICSEMNLPMMLLREFPLGIDVDRINTTVGSHRIADCVIETDEPDYPVRMGKVTVYPVGSFATTLCWPELLHALARGQVKKILRMQEYTSAPWLGRYASWFSESKDCLVDASITNMLPFLKCMFNSSLGFMGRRKYEWLPLETPGGPDWFIGRTTNPENPEHIVQAQILDKECRWLKVHGEPTEAFPAVHATICSWARIAILQIMEAAGRPNVLYVDTDGVLVNELGHLNLGKSNIPIGDNQGDLMLRHKADSCRIQGQKNYRLGDRVVCAGLSKANHPKWERTNTFMVPTGVLGQDCRVKPFVMECDDAGGEEQRYVNRIAPSN